MTVGICTVRFWIRFIGVPLCKNRIGSVIPSSADGAATLKNTILIVAPPIEKASIFTVYIGKFFVKMCASQIGAERQSGKKTGKNREKHRSCQNNASCAVHLDKPSKNNIIISIMRSVRPFSHAAGGVRRQSGAI
jgi:hypothetical protein